MADRATTTRPVRTAILTVALIAGYATFIVSIETQSFARPSPAMVVEHIDLPMVSMGSIVPIEAQLVSRRTPAFKPVVEKAAPPKGWADFCIRYAPECDVKPIATKIDIELTPATRDAIVAVNRWVNNNIKPMSDQKHWGTVNKWYYPEDGRGDCKDYALLKRRKLMEAGFPREALLLTIVWTKQKQGHAVLIVRTDKGDYVLDNLSSKVVLWSETSHDFVKRQSQTDPNVWVFIDGYY
jgi:predicted transglutaminase-like cysteine proteinase